jgi:hypothetical protein
MEENQSTPEEQAQDIAFAVESWYEFQQATRDNIRVMLDTWNTIGEIDPKETLISQMGMKVQMNRAKKQTLAILFKNIDLLYQDEFPEPDTDDTDD